MFRCFLFVLTYAVKAAARGRVPFVSAKQHKMKQDKFQNFVREVRILLTTNIMRPCILEDGRADGVL